MKAIEQYLNQPATHQLYSEGLKLAQENATVTDSALLAQLAVGPMGNNRHKLMQLLERLAASPTVQSNSVKVHAAPVAVQELTPSNSHELDLLLLLRKARQKRAQASQQLHACDSDQERAQVCDMIDRASEGVKKLEQQYSHLKRHGSLPLEEDEALPNTVDGMKKERDRLSSKRLKVENRLLYLYNLPEGSRKRKQIPDQEAKLQSINFRWLAVRWKLKQLEYHESEKDDA